MKRNEKKRKQTKKTKKKGIKLNRDKQQYVEIKRKREATTQNSIWATHLNWIKAFSLCNEIGHTLNQKNKKHKNWANYQ